MRKMSKKSDDLLKSDIIKAQTGVSHVTCYRRDRIIAYLQDRQKWKACEEFDEGKEMLEKNALS